MKKRRTKKWLKTKTKVGVRTIVITAIAVAAIAAFAAAFFMGLRIRAEVGVCVNGPRDGEMCKTNEECRDPKATKTKWYQYKLRKKAGYCLRKWIATKPPTTRATKPPATHSVKPSDSPRPPEQPSDSPRPPKYSQ